MNKIQDAKDKFLKQVNATEDVQGLKWLLEQHVKKNPACEIIKAHGLTLRQVASFCEALGEPVNVPNLSNYFNGTIPVPKKVEPILERLADILESKEAK